LISARQIYLRGALNPVLLVARWVKYVATQQLPSPAVGDLCNALKKHAAAAIYKLMCRRGQVCADLTVGADMGWW
jgi:hypothetical protein